MLRAILIIIALGSAGASAWLVSVMPTGATDPTHAEAAPAPTTEILVAAKNLEQGTQLVRAQLKWQPWPVEALNSSFILRSDEADAPAKLEGSIVLGKVVAGEPIVAAKLAAPGSSLLSAVLSPGKRAVAIAISAEQTAGGFVLPNDRVDVLLTVPCRPEDVCTGGMTVRTILRNVRVLAIDQSGSADNPQGVLIGKTATLELDPVESERVVGAAASGTLSLVLRSASDNAGVQDGDFNPATVVRIWRAGVSEYVKLN